MKIGTAVFLIFALWVGYFLYARHRSAEKRMEAEKWKGYERCTANYAPCDGDAACEQNKALARQ